MFRFGARPALAAAAAAGASTGVSGRTPQPDTRAREAPTAGASQRAATELKKGNNLSAWLQKPTSQRALFRIRSSTRNLAKCEQQAKEIIQIESPSPTTTTQARQSARTRIHKGKTFPVYSLDDVAELQERGEERGIPHHCIVTYDDGVFDVTDFVRKHPGGPFILMGKGGPLEPHWALYRQHFKRSVYDLLEKRRIGVLCERDRCDWDELQDPFTAEPVRHPSLVCLRERPYDAETPLAHLAQGFFTRNECFYVRNHFPVPAIAGGADGSSGPGDQSWDEYELTVSVPEGICLSSQDSAFSQGCERKTERRADGSEEVRRERKFTLKELTTGRQKTKTDGLRQKKTDGDGVGVGFRQHELDSCLFCTGFRGKGFSGDGFDAVGGQIGMASWRGPRLYVL